MSRNSLHPNRPFPKKPNSCGEIFSFDLIKCDNFNQVLFDHKTKIAQSAFQVKRETSFTRIQKLNKTQQTAST